VYFSESFGFVCLVGKTYFHHVRDIFRVEGFPLQNFRLKIVMVDCTVYNVTLSTFLFILLF